MKKLVALFAVVLLINFSGIVTPIHGQWQKYIIDKNIGEPVQVDAADLDGDTKPDLVVTDENDSKLSWYQNNYPLWNKHTIDSSAGKVTFALFGDMDGDDTLDVVVNIWGPRQMVWYENNHPTWTKHIIDEKTDDADFIAVADIDGDDTLDVVTAGAYIAGGDVVWYENNHPTWITHIIESGLNNYASLNVKDIDGDGLPDVIATMNRENKVVWFRNENNGLSWTKYTIGDNLMNAWGINSYDIDGDDKVDVLATGKSANDVIWYENNHPTWTKHVIDANLEEATWVDVIDVDGDDTVDVIASADGGGVVAWYENNHPTWTKHVIDANLERPRVFSITDIDGDKINDVIVPALGSLVWYKNPHTTVAYAKSLEGFPKYIPLLQGSTFELITEISNPENHQATVHAFIQGNYSTFNDSLQLFDDGLHNDGIASDNIFGGMKSLNELDEDYYNISLRTTDSDESITTYSNEKHFTTIGPLTVDHYEIPDQGQDVFQRDYFNLNLFLKNNGSIAPAIKVRADLSTADSNVISITGKSQDFGTINPDQIKINGSWDIRVYTQNNPDSVKFDVSVFSNDISFWNDSITVKIPSNTGSEDLSSNISAETELYQCYPNPFSHSTNISYSIPNSTFVILKVTDLYGREIQTLVDQFQKADKYNVEFDASKLPSGIYFYRLEVGNDFVKTKKMMYSR